MNNKNIQYVWEIIFLISIEEKQTRTSIMVVANNIQQIWDYLAADRKDEAVEIESITRVGPIVSVLSDKKETNSINSDSICGCKNEYNIEPHGNGYALYLGRCDHRHGYNLANLIECDMPKLNMMLDKLNK